MADERDDLDLLLDDALADYGRSEPSPGLEGRVLAALRSEPRTPWWSALLRPRPARVAFAAAALLVLAAGIAVVLRQGSRDLVPAVQSVASGEAPIVAEAGAPPPPAASPQVTPPGDSGAPEPTLTAPGSSRPAVARLVPTGRAPHRPTFPAAAPLGEQEQLLLRFVVEAPRDEVERRAGFLDQPAPLPPLPDQRTEP